MYRYVVECYIDNIMFYNMEFKSITSVCKFLDRFTNCNELDIWFEVYDSIKGNSLNVKELMSIWHA